MSSLYLGVDIGGTSAKVGLVDENGGIAAITRVDTVPEIGAERFIDRIMAAGRELLSGCSKLSPRLEGVGVGCAGLVSARGGVLIASPNLPGWENAPLGRIFAAATDVDVFLDNDANSFAYGEARAGAAAGRSHGVFLTLGTGVGGGLLLDGRIYRGCNGFGAELGHVVINSDGPVCECGNRGCLESLIGAKAIVETATRLYGEADRAGDLSGLGGGDAGAVTPEILSRAAFSGDEHAAQVFREVGRWLGIAVGGFINVFNPQIVIIGGGVAQAGERLLEPARHWAGRYAFSASYNSAIIAPASLGENAGLVGAALEARDRCGIPCS